MKTKLTAALLALAIATPAAALQPLHQNERVYHSFYVLGLADTIRKKCDDIAPRVINAYSYLRSLHGYAKDLGYSDDQIDALLENKDEKRKLRAIIDAELAKRGASPENPEGYCVVGREEIAKGTEAGRLLRVK